MSTQTDYLLPCPFCGSAPKVTERASIETATGRFWFIACFCGGYSTCAHKNGETEEKAYKAWNTRASATRALKGNQMNKEVMQGAWLGQCSTEEVCRAINGAATDDFFQNSTDGKFYKLNESVGVTEIFRASYVKTKPVQPKESMTDKEVMQQALIEVQCYVRYGNMEQPYALMKALQSAIAQPQQSAAMPDFNRCDTTPYGMVRKECGYWVQYNDVAAAWPKSTS